MKYILDSSVAVKWVLVEPYSEGEGPMVKQVTERTRKKLRKATHRKPKPEIGEQEDEILRAATLELVTKHGGHFVATGLRETRIKGIRVWIITVTLRYTTDLEATSVTCCTMGRSSRS